MITPESVASHVLQQFEGKSPSKQELLDAVRSVVDVRNNPKGGQLDAVARRELIRSSSLLVIDSIYKRLPRSSSPTRRTDSTSITSMPSYSVQQSSTEINSQDSSVQEDSSKTLSVEPKFDDSVIDNSKSKKKKKAKRR